MAGHDEETMVRLRMERARQEGYLREPDPEIPEWVREAQRTMWRSGSAYYFECGGCGVEIISAEREGRCVRCGAGYDLRR